MCSATNHLYGQPSLYLQQHAHNPVEWYPWGPEALARAQAEDKPILLSIGYSSCHWCHVMAHESFEDAETAGLMNERYVNIKVDREERPDLDEVYMAAVQLLAGQGGWPMTVFLTPDLRPFFGGTYFPPAERQGLPSFRRVLSYLAEQYRHRRPEVEQIAADTAARVLRSVQADWTAGPLSASLLPNARAQLLEAHDPRFGGFSARPKFPQAATLRLLLHLAGESAAARAAVRQTLDGMAAGGMYDLAGGGFHRYSVDDRWLVPHFEKMLYDNALLAVVYLEGYQHFGEPAYRRVTEQTLDYLLREMRLSAGGFAAAQDADSPEGEGRFFAWTPVEFAAAAGPQDAGWAAEFLGVTEKGNYHAGLSLLRQQTSLPEWAGRLGTTPTGAAAPLDALCERLREARLAQRIAPARDDKALADWNGLTLSALARAGQVLDAPRYLAAAQDLAEFLSEHMISDEGLHHMHVGGQAIGEGFLDDYAHAAGGLLDLHAAQGEARWLFAAERLTVQAIERFDEGQGGFTFSALDHGTPLARPLRYADLPVPSGNAAMASNLLRLGELLERPAWQERGRRTLERFAGGMARRAQTFSAMLLAFAQAASPKP